MSSLTGTGLIASSRRAASAEGCDRARSCHRRSRRRRRQRWRALAGASSGGWPRATVQGYREDLAGFVALLRRAPGRATWRWPTWRRWRWPTCAPGWPGAHHAGLRPHLDRARRRRGAQLLPLRRPPHGVHNPALAGDAHAAPAASRCRGRWPRPTPRDLIDHPRAPRRASPGWASATPPCSCCSTAPACGSARRWRWTARDLGARPARAAAACACAARATRSGWCRSCRSWPRRSPPISPPARCRRCRDEPLFKGARGGRLQQAVVQKQVRQLRGQPGPARDRHAARAAPQLRHPSAGRRRRPARDPGAVGPRQPVDDAGLYRGRRRAPDDALPSCAPARLNASAAWWRWLLRPGAEPIAESSRRFFAPIQVGPALRILIVIAVVLAALIAAGRSPYRTSWSGTTTAPS